jgi:hypothetical protein
MVVFVLALRHIWSLSNWQRSWKLGAIKYYPTSKLDGHIWSILWNMCLSIALSFYGCIHIHITKFNFYCFYENIKGVEYYYATLKYNSFFDWICTIQGCVCVWFHKNHKNCEEVCHMYYNFEFLKKAMQSLISMFWLTLLTKAHNMLLFTILNTKVDHLGFQFYGQHILYMDRLFNNDMIVHGFVTRGIYVKVMI